MRKIALLIITFAFVNCKAQQTTVTTKENNTPKLVIGIVVDQMRYDYLTRFANKFGNDGFNRLINDGYNCKNHHFNYVPTYTGPGHTSIYTGTSPMNHGIIANYWYNKFTNKSMYCADDASVKCVGFETEKERMSPKNMLTTTIGDQLRLHTQQKAKVIGVSLKDRGAILPAGHSANAAYWFSGKKEGKWVTSTYYTQKLPKWVVDFNENTADYIQTWNTLLPLERYTESGADLNTYERNFKGKETATFPYHLKKIASKNKGFDILKSTPFGNDMTTDFAMATIKNEQLGVDNITDMLTISYSATDYVGHRFGVNSVEIEDTYIRLDRSLAKLFSFLDSRVGNGNYTLFLTADHGAVQVPHFLEDQKIPAGYFDNKAFKKQVEKALVEKFKLSGLIKNISNQQIFLDRTLILNYDLNLSDIETFLVQQIVLFKHIDKAYTADALNSSQFTNGTGALIQNGYHQKRSGDVVFVLEPSVISYPETGSTHGSSFSYDTHVPLLFYGNGIQTGSTFTRTEVIDIAPTISALLGIAFPSGCSGNPLEMVIKK